MALAGVLCMLLLFVVGLGSAFPYKTWLGLIRNVVLVAFGLGVLFVGATALVFWRGTRGSDSYGSAGIGAVSVGVDDFFVAALGASGLALLIANGVKRYRRRRQAQSR